MSTQEQAQAGPTRVNGLVFQLAGACGIVAMGSYLSQPLTVRIAADLRMAPALAGFIVTLTQIGYCTGLLLVSPLADRLENRRLLSTILAGSGASMLLAAFAASGIGFFVAAAGIGICSVAVQLVVAHAARLCNAASRGRVVGGVTGGLLWGILAAWPVANVLGDALGWRALFLLEAAAILALIPWLRSILPAYQPQTRSSYPQTVASLPGYWRVYRELRQRTYIQSLLFGVFSMTWTALPFWLRQRYGFHATGIAGFGLAGAAGALVAPLAGRAADSGRTIVTSVAAIIAVAAAGLALCFDPPWGVLLMAVLCISAGVQASHVVSQRRVLALEPIAANRLNSLYVGGFFLGGAAGSAFAVPLFRGHPAWIGVAGVFAAGLALAFARSLRSS
ncbi:MULTISPECIES: MFS transporter [Paraburkholderia]|uniref:MFS transporter n=1 Tax=Paraburkholderia TaxID=1822464 RepID=UPI0015957C0A|nr:MFS transporter [Paraburkholderia youngii]